MGVRKCIGSSRALLGRHPVIRCLRATIIVTRLIRLEKEHSLPIMPDALADSGLDEVYWNPGSIYGIRPAAGILRCYLGCSSR